MTRRERMEQRLAKREEWAAKAKARAAQRFKAADDAVAGIPMGQPILVGHHSERRHRRAVERAQDNGFKGVEEMRLAEHHVSKAGGLADQLDRSVFSDDADAIEQLEARIAEREAQAEKYLAINKAWRKAKGDVQALVASGVCSAALAQTITETMRLAPWLKQPLDATNLRAAIRRDRERIEDIRRRQERAATAEASGGVHVAAAAGCDWCTVTFAEKPARAVLDALKAAGFRWGAGSWHGPASKLPAGVTSA